MKSLTLLLTITVLALAQTPAGGKRGPKAAFELVQATLTRTVIAEDPCNSTTAAETRFLTTDPAVWLTVAYRGAASGEQGSVEWVQPSGTVHVTNGITARADTTAMCAAVSLPVAGQSAAALAGNWSFRVKWAGAEVTAGRFEIATPPNSAVAPLTASVLPAATVGGSYEAKLAATGGTPPYVWTLTEGSLPGGLSLDPAGTLRGSPAATGSYSFTLGIADSAGIRTTRVFALAVSAPTLITSPRNTTFHYAEGENIAPQTAKVTSTGGSIAFTTAVSPPAPWLQVTSTGTTTPADLTLRVTGSGLRPNNYETTVIISSASGSRAFIVVRLVVEPADGPSAVLPIIDSFAGASWQFPRQGAAANAPLSDALSFAVDATGDLFIADADNHVIVRLGKDGKYTPVAGTGIAAHSGDGGSAVDASINTPNGIAFDSQGNLFVAETNGNRIRRISSSGTIITVAGAAQRGSSGDGGPAVDARLEQPRHIAVDAQDNVYFLDTNNFRVRRISPAGIITTVVGDGTRGAPTEGAAATRTTSGVISGLTVASNGDLILAYAVEGRIRRVRDGMITTIAGAGGRGGNEEGGPAIEAQLRQPTGVAFDRSGNLYVTERDRTGARIRRINNAGRIFAFVGTGPGFGGDGGPALNALIRLPDAIAVDPAGNVYFSDSGNQRVRQVSPNGTISTVMGNGLFRHNGNDTPRELAYFFGPGGLALDSGGTLYISETLNNRIKTITGGMVRHIAGEGPNGDSEGGGRAIRAEFSSPRGLAIDAAGNLYVADSVNNTIRRITPGGLISSFAGRPATDALITPVAVAVDAGGNVYIAELGGHRVVRVTPTKTMTTVAGTGSAGFTGDGGPGERAQLRSPSGLAFDKEGNLYIADSGNHRVRRLSASGNITTIAGSGTQASTGDSGPARNASLNTPQSLAFDAAGNLFIAENTGNRIRRIDSEGNISTAVGSGASGFAGDGGPAPAANLNRPTAVLVDAGGNLLIADSENHVIRIVKSTPPTVDASRDTLTFDSDGNVSETLEIRSSQRFIALRSATARTVSGGNWLQVTPSNGVLPARLTARVSLDGLEPGRYEGSIVVSTGNTAKPRLTIAVVANVKAPRPPKLRLETERLTFTIADNGEPQTAQIGISTPSRQPLTVAGSLSGAPWASWQTSSATVAAGEPANLSLSISPAGLRPGTYTGSAVLSGAFENDQTTATVPIRLIVTRQQRAILLTQTGFVFRAATGGGAPLPNTLGIINNGQGQLNWTATATTLSGGTEWLKIDKQGGTLARPLEDLSNISVSADPTNLNPGEYFGKVEIRAPGADNSPQIATVVLNVAEAGTRLPPEVRPTSLVFIGTPGSSPGAQRIQVANLMADSTAFASNALTADGGSFFVHSPMRSEVKPGQPVEIVVQPDLVNSTAGVRTGVLTLVFSDGTPQTVQITSVLSNDAQLGISTSASKGVRAAGNCSPTYLQMSTPQLSDREAAFLGQPVALEARVYDNCGTPVSRGRGVVSARFSNGDPTLSMDSLPAGVWTKTWRPQSRAVSQAVATITAFMALPNNQFLAEQRQITFDLRSDTKIPQIRTVQNAASFASNSPVAPGMQISIFGNELSDATGAQAGSTPRPTVLEGTEVRLADRPLPLEFVSGMQVNAQLPFDLPLDTEHQLLIRRGGILSTPEPVVIAAAQPAVFTVAQNGQGQAIVRNASSNEIADAKQPAQAGDRVLIYCTGLGRVSGDVAPGSTPSEIGSAPTVNSVEVQIDGQSAPVEFAGLAPGLIGTYVVRAVVPEGVRASDAAPLVVRAAGLESPVVTMAIRGR